MKSKFARFKRKISFTPALIYILLPIIYIISHHIDVYFHPEHSFQHCFLDKECQSIFKGINIAGIITALAGYLGIGFTYYTINTNRLASQEKNALDLEKTFDSKEVREGMKTLHTLRKKYLKSNGFLDRPAISRYMRSLADVKIHELTDNLIDDKEIDSLGLNHAKVKKHFQAKEKISEIESIHVALNVIESCANGIRYGIYDEIVIYNIYGSQIVSIYEVAYRYIKERQKNSSSLFVNLEWLSIKWTLEKEIYKTNSGRASHREEKTSDIIKKAHFELNMFRKCGRKKGLKKSLKEIKKYTYPG